MNVWIKSLATLSLLTGPLLLNASAGAAPAPISAATATSTPAQDALDVLAARPGSPLPAGTKLLSLRLAGGLATADFSHELRDNFTGGDSGDIRTVNAILSTLGKFPTIRRVQLLVQGKPVDSIGGLLELSDPLPVLRPTADATTTAPPPRRWLHRTPRPAAPATKTYAL